MGNSTGYSLVTLAGILQIHVCNLPAVYICDCSVQFNCTLTIVGALNNTLSYILLLYGFDTPGRLSDIEVEEVKELKRSKSTCQQLFSGVSRTLMTFAASNIRPRAGGKIHNIDRRIPTTAAVIELFHLEGYVLLLS